MSALLFSIVLALGHFFSDKIQNKFKENKNYLLSFAAGISVAYIFLEIIPLLNESVINFNRSLFFYVLFGFTFIHIIERHVHHHKKKKILAKELKEVHSIVFFIYHFLIGIILVEIGDAGVFKGFLFFFPILFHTVISGVSLEKIHFKIREKFSNKALLSISPVIGSLVALNINIPSVIKFGLIGFVSGVLLYMVIRDSLPSDREGKPLWFLIGLLIYSLLIVWTWSVV